MTIPQAPGEGPSDIPSDPSTPPAGGPPTDEVAVPPPDEAAVPPTDVAAVPLVPTTVEASVPLPDEASGPLPDEASGPLPDEASGPLPDVAAAPPTDVAAGQSASELPVAPATAPNREASPVRSPLTTLVQAVGLLGGAGLSVGLGLWLLLVPDRAALVKYAAHNDLAPDRRWVLLGFMAGAAVLLLAGVALWSALRKPGLAAVQRLAWRLSPLLLTGLLPLLFAWQVWVERDITFLVLVLAVGLGAQALLLRSGWTESLPAVLRAYRPARLAAGWCGRIPRQLRLSPAWIALLLGAAGYALFFSVHTVIGHWNFRTFSFDLGLENNILWNIVHGGPFFKSSPFSGPTGSHFGNHATFLAYAIAPIYALAQRPETLLVLQAVLVGAAAVPLFLFGRRLIGQGPALLVAFCYLIYPPVHGANLYDFHYPTVAPFFVWMVAYLLDSRRDRLAIVAIILALSVREDIAAGLVVLGAFFLITGRRPRAGLALALVSGCYFIAMKFFLMPMFKGNRHSFLRLYEGLLPAGEASLSGVLKTIFGNPPFTLHTLLTEDKLVFALQILVPLAFIPLRRPIGYLLLLPGLFFSLLTTSPHGSQIKICFQYTAHWTIYLFIGLIMGLEYLARPRFSGDARGPARFRAALATLVLVSLACSYQYGALFQQNTARGGFVKYTFGTQPEDLARRKAAAELFAMVPPRAKIVASERLVPHVSNRPDAYTLRYGVWDARYVLYDESEFRGSEKNVLIKALKSKEFGVLATRPPFVLLERGKAPHTARRLLSKLQPRKSR